LLLASCDPALRHDLRRNVQIGLNLGFARRCSGAPGFNCARHVDSVATQVAG
jgi:hypothetical protein